MQYLVIGIRCMIGVVFLISAISKIVGRGAFTGFTASVRDMQVVPSSAVQPIAFGVITAEIIACALLATPNTAAVVTGFVIVTALMLAFAIAIGETIRGGVRTPCRCFGGSSVPLGRPHIARNIILAVLATLGASGSLWNGSASADGIVIALIAGIVLGGLVVRLDDILELFQPISKPADSAASWRRGRRSEKLEETNDNAHLDRSSGVHRSAVRLESDPHTRRDQTSSRTH